MIHSAAKVSIDVNRKCLHRNTPVQLSTPYTDPECDNTFCPPDRWTLDSQTDDSIMLFHWEKCCSLVNEKEASIQQHNYVYQFLTYISTFIRIIGIRIRNIRI